MLSLLPPLFYSLIQIAATETADWPRGIHVISWKLRASRHRAYNIRGLHCGYNDLPSRVSDHIAMSKMSWEAFD